MKRAWTLLAMLVFAVPACDRDAAYTPDELAIETRFERIAVGDFEQDVRAHLGEPICVLYAIAGSQDELEVRCPESSPPVRLRAEDRSTWPTELPGLPKRPPTYKALVYADGGVRAYYLVDEQGRVEFLHVQMT